MKAPSQLAQVFVWFALLGAGLAAVMNADQRMIPALIAASTALGGLLGSIIKRPIAGALIGASVMAFLAFLLVFAATQSARE